MRFAPPAEGVPLEIGYRRRESKTRTMGLPGWERSLTISPTWRTDGQTPDDSKDRAYKIRIASRGKMQERWCEPEKKGSRLPHTSTACCRSIAGDRPQAPPLCQPHQCLYQLSTRPFLSVGHCVQSMCDCECFACHKLYRSCDVRSVHKTKNYRLSCMRKVRSSSRSAFCFGLRSTDASFLLPVTARSGIMQDCYYWWWWWWWWWWLEFQNI